MSGGVVTFPALAFTVEVTAYRDAPDGERIGLAALRIPELGLSFADVPILEDAKGHLRVGETGIELDTARERHAFAIAVLAGVYRLRCASDGRPDHG